MSPPRCRWTFDRRPPSLYAPAPLGAIPRGRRRSPAGLRTRTPKEELRHAPGFIGGDVAPILGDGPTRRGRTMSRQARIAAATLAVLGTGLAGLLIRRAR